MKRLVKVTDNTEREILLYRVAVATCEEYGEFEELHEGIEITATKMELVLDADELQDAYEHAVIIWCANRIHKAITECPQENEYRDYGEIANSATSRFCKQYQLPKQVVTRIRGRVDWLRIGCEMSDSEGNL